MFKEKADALAHQISTTDIKRINGYMRLANLVCAALLEVTCVIRLFSVPSYAHFLVVIYIMYVVDLKSHVFSGPMLNSRISRLAATGSRLARSCFLRTTSSSRRSRRK